MLREKVCTVLDLAERHFSPGNEVDKNIVKYYVEKSIDCTVLRRNSRELLKLNRIGIIRA
jgi:hypothetical protein